MKYGYCTFCRTLVQIEWRVSLTKGTPSSWWMLPHRWEGRQNCKSACGRRARYDHARATGARLSWQRRMVAADAAMTKFVINANNEELTKSRTG